MYNAMNRSSSVKGLMNKYRGNDERKTEDGLSTSESSLDSSTRERSLGEDGQGEGEDDSSNLHLRRHIRDVIKFCLGHDMNTVLNCMQKEMVQLEEAEKIYVEDSDLQKISSTDRILGSLHRSWDRSLQRRSSCPQFTHPDELNEDYSLTLDLKEAHPALHYLQSANNKHVPDASRPIRDSLLGLVKNASQGVTNAARDTVPSLKKNGNVIKENEIANLDDYVNEVTGPGSPTQTTTSQNGQRRASLLSLRVRLPTGLLVKKLVGSKNGTGPNSMRRRQSFPSIDNAKWYEELAAVDQI
jgi:hypothetical protein